MQPLEIKTKWNPVRNSSQSDDGIAGLVESELNKPTFWRKPRCILVNPGDDLFHENIKDKWIDQIFSVMALAKQHTFMVLTKWPRRMRMWFNSEPDKRISGYPAWPLPNVWLGVSAENQHAADERIPALMATPAAVRFVSCEPLLGPVDLTRWLRNPPAWAETCSQHRETRGIDWVIAGGESGHGARPMHPDWVRAIRDECAKCGTAFFFKQWGKWLPEDQIGADGDKPTPATTGSEWGVLDADGRYFRHTARWMTGPGVYSDDGEIYVYRVGKRNASRLLDGREHLGFPVKAERAERIRRVS